MAHIYNSILHYTLTWISESVNKGSSHERPTWYGEMRCPRRSCCLLSLLSWFSGASSASSSCHHKSCKDGTGERLGICSPTIHAQIQLKLHMYGDKKKASHVWICMHRTKKRFVCIGVYATNKRIYIASQSLVVFLLWLAFVALLDGWAEIKALYS